MLESNINKPKRDVPQGTQLHVQGKAVRAAGGHQIVNALADFLAELPALRGADPSTTQKIVSKTK